MSDGQNIIALVHPDNNALECLLNRAKEETHAKAGVDISIVRSISAAERALTTAAGSRALFLSEPADIGFDAERKTTWHERAHALLKHARIYGAATVIAAAEWRMTEPWSHPGQYPYSAPWLAQKTGVDSLLQYAPTVAGAQVLAHNLLTLLAAHDRLHLEPRAVSANQTTMNIITGGGGSGKSTIDNKLFDGYRFYEDDWRIRPVIRVKARRRKEDIGSHRTKIVSNSQFDALAENGRLICPYEINHRKYGSYTPNRGKDMQHVYVSRPEGVIDIAHCDERMLEWALARGWNARVFFLDASVEERGRRLDVREPARRQLDAYVEAVFDAKKFDAQLDMIRAKLPSENVLTYNTHPENNPLAKILSEQPDSICAMNTAIDIARQIARNIYTAPVSHKD